MNFMFEWQEQYLTRSLRLYKRTDNGVFDDFPKISDHFTKIPNKK